MKKVLAFILIILVFLQFFQIERKNPPVDKDMDFISIKNTPDQTAKIIRNSCYDCHSNETVYPWYSYTQPAGWLLANHIKEGRQHLNFSTFATYDTGRQIHKLEECVEMIEKDEMPLESYLLGHPDAKLSPENKKEIIDFFTQVKNQIKNTQSSL